MSTIKTETLSTPSNATVPVDTVVNGTAKAWVNFNGTGTVAIRRAFNVSSITDAGTGYYEINFTTAMPDANYAAATQGNFANAAANWGYVGFERGVRSATGYVVQFALTNSFGTIDPEVATVTIFS